MLRAICLAVITSSVLPRSAAGGVLLWSSPPQQELRHLPSAGGNHQVLLGALEVLLVGLARRQQPQPVGPWPRSRSDHEMPAGDCIHAPRLREQRLLPPRQLVRPVLSDLNIRQWTCAHATGQVEHTRYARRRSVLRHDHLVRDDCREGSDKLVVSVRAAGKPPAG